MNLKHKRFIKTLTLYTFLKLKSGWWPGPGSLQWSGNWESGPWTDGGRTHWSWRRQLRRRPAPWRLKTKEPTPWRPEPHTERRTILLALEGVWALKHSTSTITGHSPAHCRTKFICHLDDENDNRKNAKWFVGFLSGLFVVFWHFVCLNFFLFCPDHLKLIWHFVWIMKFDFCLGREGIRIN